MNNYLKLSINELLYHFYINKYDSSRYFTIDKPAHLLNMVKLNLVNALSGFQQEISLSVPISLTINNLKVLLENFKIIFFSVPIKISRLKFFLNLNFAENFYIEY